MQPIVPFGDPPPIESGFEFLKKIVPPIEKIPRENPAYLSFMLYIQFLSLFIKASPEKFLDVTDLSGCSGRQRWLSQENGSVRHL